MLVKFLRVVDEKEETKINNRNCQKNLRDRFRIGGSKNGFKPEKKNQSLLDRPIKRQIDSVNLNPTTLNAPSLG